MRFALIAALILLPAGVGACASRSGDQTIAAYCADPKRSDHDLCKVHADVEATRGDVRRNRADLDVTREVADRADRNSTEALRLAGEAKDNLTCVTRTLRRTDVGACEPGFVLTSCSQSRYTTRSGGPTVLRDINDEQCRFATRVLEIKVRCCHVGNTPPLTTASVEEKPKQQSPLPTS